MCGRFTLTVDDILKLANRFHASPPSIDLIPHYNLAPSQQTLTVVNWDGKRRLVPMHWGLIPFWSRKSQRPQILINVRSESLIKKPIFKSYWRKRCLIPADGFFEWKKEGQKRIPFRTIVKDEPLFSFAGLWEHVEEDEENYLNCFTILTTEANQLLYSIHDRMPVVLTSEGEDKWLDPDLHSPEQLYPLLKPFPDSRMEMYEVSIEVNSTRHDTPKCIEPKHHGLRS